MNIISLLPSATEIIRALGLDHRLVGISHSCEPSVIYRDQVVVTQTNVPYRKDSETIDQFVRSYVQEHKALYELDIIALNYLSPDFIVSQNLCDVCAVSTADLAAARSLILSAPQIIHLEPNTLGDVLDDCLRVGKALDVDELAKSLVSNLCERRDAVENISRNINVRLKPRVVFLEWLMPPFNAGHWTPELISLAGGIDVLGNPGKPSNGLLWADIVSAQPDVIVVACCGFSTERSHVDLYELGQRMELKSVWSHLGDTRVIILDGKFFSCPSPGLIDGLEILAHVLHPNYHAKLHNVCYSWFKLSDFMA